MAIQNYYTTPRCARGLAQLTFSHLRRRPGSILDLGAGSGRLVRALRAHHPFPRHSPWDPDTLLVEPDETREAELRRCLRDREGDQLHLTTLEEWALTWARPRMVDLVVANPPFGARVGRTRLGEFARQLHLPTIERFEAYFLTVMEAVCAQAAVLVVPASFLRTDPARPVLEAVHARGLELVDARQLPLDGFEDCVVSTVALWFLRREGPAPDRSLALLDQLDELPPLHAHAPPITRTHRYGTLTGYEMPTDDLTILGVEARPTLEVPSPEETSDAPSSWPACVLEPPALGILRVRGERMWELGPRGWQLAQSQGYVDGRPGPELMETARLAFRCLRRGALELCAHLCQTLDLEALRTQCAEMPSASFVHMLPSKPADPEGVMADVRRLGLLEIEGLEDALARAHTPAELDGLRRIGPYLFDEQTWTLAQRAHVWLEHRAQMPGAMREAIAEELRGHSIPLEHLELRAAWLGRDWVAREFGLTFDEDGHFVPDETPGARRARARWDIPSVRGLVAYLNYSRGPRRIRDGDAEAYELLSHRLAQAAHHWEEPTREAWRLELHARYLAAHRTSRRVVSGARPVASQIELHPWQREDLGFCLSGQGLLDWDVGLGKTAAALHAAVHHVGLSLIAVPKSVLAKWKREAETFFGQMRCEILGFRQTRTGRWRRDSQGFEDQVRELFFVDPPDLILTSHRVLQDFQLKPSTWGRADEADARAMLGHARTRTGELAHERFVWRAATRNFIDGGELYFEDLPLAQMYVIIDEAHRYKSLHKMPSAGWGDRLVMAGSCGESKRARDLKIKFDLLRTAGGKTLGLSATPVTNSIAELFNMMRIFAPRGLERRRLQNVQQLIDTYCRLEPITTVSPTGTVVSGQTLTGFRATEDLNRLLSEAMRSRTASSVGLKLPEEREHICRIEPTPQIRRAIRRLQGQLDELVRGTSSPQASTPHIFEILAAIDEIAACPGAAGLTGPDPKAEALCARVLEGLERPGTGQLIFADRLAAQQALYDRLVAHGVPADQIQCVHAKTASSISQRLTLSDAFNDGRLRILLGGEVMCEGMDLQKRCRAIHFVNLGWESQSIHQRKGRGIRQGNPLEYVDVYYYILEGSTDVYRLATSRHKSHWFEQLRQAQLGRPVSHISIFADPLDETLISSLSADPEETLELLERRRCAAELDRQLERARRLGWGMLEFAGPARREVNLRMLWRHEQALRALDWIDPSMCDRIVRRARGLADYFARELEGACSAARWRGRLRDQARLEALHPRAKHAPSRLFALRAEPSDEEHAPGGARLEFVLGLQAEVSVFAQPSSFESAVTRARAAPASVSKTPSPQGPGDRLELIWEPAPRTPELEPGQTRAHPSRGQLELGSLEVDRRALEPAANHDHERRPRGQLDLFGASSHTA